MTTQTRVALVGHCGPDAFALRSFITSTIPGASVEFITDRRALDEALPGLRALLVNRVLDGSFDSDHGIGLIAELSERDGTPPAMLISNFPESQAEAEGAGALPGFGKSQLYTDVARDRLRAAIALQPRH